MASIWQQINDAAAQVVDDVCASVVQITSDEGSLGAGTIWHRDGLIITNAHVVMGRQARRNLHVILSDGRTYAAQLIAADTERDIAALAIQAHDLPTIDIGNSRQLKPGQYLMALGHPFGVLEAVTGGVVIGTGDRLPEQAGHREWIVLDLKMRPGHSGGPLFDEGGRLVGINTMIQGPLVSFAVPVDVVKTFLKETIGSYAPPQAAADAPGDEQPVVV